MASRLEGKVAIITGATSGIGEVTAQCFAAEGASLVVAGRTVDKGEGLAQKLGDRVLFQRADVLHEADIAALVDTAISRFGRLDCLFNNAGASKPRNAGDRYRRFRLSALQLRAICAGQHTAGRGRRTFIAAFNSQHYPAIGYGFVIDSQRAASG